MAPICQRLSESMWPTALGLLVGLIALWSYEYLAGELSALDREMRNASLELLNQLSRFQGRFAFSPGPIPSIESPMFGEKPWPS
jgi:biopolymer transport protein ExbB/TolQ